MCGKRTQKMKFGEKKMTWMLGMKKIEEEAEKVSPTITRNVRLLAHKIDNLR